MNWTSSRWLKIGLTESGMPITVLMPKRTRLSMCLYDAPGFFRVSHLCPPQTPIRAWASRRLVGFSAVWSDLQSDQTAARCFRLSSVHSVLPPFGRAVRLDLKSSRDEYQHLQCSSTSLQHRISALQMPIFSGRIANPAKRRQYLAKRWKVRPNGWRTRYVWVSVVGQRRLPRKKRVRRKLT